MYVSIIENINYLLILNSCHWETELIMLQMTYIPKKLSLYVCAIAYSAYSRQEVCQKMRGLPGEETEKFIKLRAS